MFHLFIGGVWCQQLHLAHLYFCLLVVFGVNSCTWHTCTFVYWRCLVSTAAPGTPVLLGVTRDAAQPAGSTSVLPAGGSTGRLRLLVQPGPYGLLGETLLLLALCTPSPLPYMQLVEPQGEGTPCTTWAYGLLGEMLLALCIPHPYMQLVEPQGKGTSW